METDHLSHEEYVDLRRRQVVAMASETLEDGIALLLKVCQINSALHELPELNARVAEPDRLFLTGVSSEVDEFPLGHERQYWAPNSLLEKDREARSYAELVRKDVLATFARIADSLR